VKAKGNIISFLLVIDTFFIAYAAGFNSHPVLVVDLSLPPLAKPEPKAAVESKKSSDKTAEKTNSPRQDAKSEPKSGAHGIDSTKKHTGKHTHGTAANKIKPPVVDH
jgi:hypothetical protein